MSAGKGKPSNAYEMEGFIHCGLCLDEIPDGVSPDGYARFEVGFTVRGLQIWCRRHDCNVMHIDFQGVKHPANTTRAVKGGAK